MALIAPPLRRNKAIFLDRDGVLNVERGDYVWQPPAFEIAPGVVEWLPKLKAAGYRLIVVTNQGGIAKGLYTNAEVWDCHQLIQEATGGVLDALYYSPYRDNQTRSLMRKPDSLMLERGAARFLIDMNQSWLFGDAERDLVAAKKVGVAGRILIPTEKEKESAYATHVAPNFEAAARIVLGL